jgi:acyl carrier protein
MENTLEKLIGILQMEFEELSGEVIHPSDIVQEKLPLSSMNLAILLTCIELDFEVSLSADEIKKAETFADLACVIALKNQG